MGASPALRTRTTSQASSRASGSPHAQEVCELAFFITTTAIDPPRGGPVIPISEHQDTVGPLTRSVADAAIVLSIIAGPDANDNFTLAQPVPVPDYVRALNRSALTGKRIGVPRAVFLNDSVTGNDPYVNEVFEGALGVLRALGATVVDPANLPSAEAIAMSGNETVVLNTDFKVRVRADRCMTAGDMCGRFN